MNNWLFISSFFLFVAVVYFGMEYYDLEKLERQIPKSDPLGSDQKGNLTDLMFQMLKRNKNEQSLEVELSDSKKEVNRLEYEIEKNKN